MNLLVVVVVLVLTGWVRMGYEHALSEELERERVLTPAFDMESRAGLSQKGFIATFGSLRPTLAALTVLSSSKHHTNQDWTALEGAIETSVMLDPYNPYYWDLGAWHMAYNAAGSYQKNEEYAPLRRQRLFKESIYTGDSLLERGIHANPEDLGLRLQRARLWSSVHRIQDFPRVVEILQRALTELELSDQQRLMLQSDLFYTLMRMPEKVQEAYALGRWLYESAPSTRVPSLVNGLCALQMHPKVKVDEPIGMAQLYGNKANAIRLVSNYLRDEDPVKPRYGMQALLDRLRAEPPSK
ncbi:hypothetical protein [Rubritalea tangerina]|uniref:DUF4034 domain-containing protein n=1 Tax=Rubritalea tangerina TaxID=430798 RepID=A0ABW4Z7F6_9BACT